jgi:hypothetical protein
MHLQEATASELGWEHWAIMLLSTKPHITPQKKRLNQFLTSNGFIVCSEIKLHVVADLAAKSNMCHVS